MQDESELFFFLVRRAAGRPPCYRLANELKLKESRWNFTRFKMQSKRLVVRFLFKEVVYKIFQISDNGNH